LRVLTLVAKDQACEHPDKACHGDACPLARGFYDKLPAARQAAVRAAWLDAPALRRLALAHEVCPYYLGQELSRWADVLVGDVNHYLDARALIWGLQQAEEWKLSVLIDEAHNVVERARQMYSADLTPHRVNSQLTLAPAALRSPLGALLSATQALLGQASTDYHVLADLPKDWHQALQVAAAALAEHFHAQPLAVGPLLDFHFDLQYLVYLCDMLGEHSLFELHTQADTDTGSGLDDDAAAVVLRNVVPAVFLRQRFKQAHSVTLFSATLAPPSYAIDLLGLPDNTAWLDVPPAFAAEHLVVRVADEVSTRYGDRAASLDALVRVMTQQFDIHPGNYLAFFSSFEYLEKAADRLADLRPDVLQWRQDRRMLPDARQSFLARFTEGGQGVGFAVLGGVFGEGVDLPGTLLVGAFIATLGLPPVSPAQAQIQARLTALFGEGKAYADLVPAMQKVVQAAGRILRTPEDRGWLWLMDDRYRRSDVRALLPPWWQIR
jgi:Rad3-related DNA helicase